jgi:hypothetical protein
MYKLAFELAIPNLAAHAAHAAASLLQSQSLVNVTNAAYNKTLTDSLELAPIVADRLTILKNQGHNLISPSIQVQAVVLERVDLESLRTGRTSLHRLDSESQPWWAS